jgi:hypothetical protein
MTRADAETDRCVVSTFPLSLALALSPSRPFSTHVGRLCSAASTRKGSDTGAVRSVVAVAGRVDGRVVCIGGDECGSRPSRLRQL